MICIILYHHVSSIIIIWGIPKKNGIPLYINSGITIGTSQSSNGWELGVARPVFPACCGWRRIISHSKRSAPDTGRPSGRFPMTRLESRGMGRSPSRMAVFHHQKVMVSPSKIKKSWFHYEKVMIFTIVTQSPRFLARWPSKLMNT